MSPQLFTSEWANAAKTPFGLAGLALALLFGYLAKNRKHDKWMSTVAVILSATCVVAGLWMGHDQIQARRPASRSHQTNNVTQQSTGQGSPNINGVQGDVNYDYRAVPDVPKQQKPSSTHDKAPANSRNPRASTATSADKHMNGTGKQSSAKSDQPTQ